jgi:TonB family protein
LTGISLLGTALGLLMTQTQAPEAPPILYSVPPAPPVPPVYVVPAPPSPPVSPGPGVVIRPAAIGRHRWIQTDDYPAAALRNEEQGLVMVVLQVGAEGRVLDCRITFSSGSTALDSTTCRIFRSRARYRPARNRAGDAVAAMVREQVRWVLPPEPILFEPAYALVSVRLADGRVGRCTRTGEIPAGAPLSSEACSTFAPMGLIPPAAIAQGHLRFSIAVETIPDGVARVERPAPPAGLRPMFEANADIELDAAGAVTSCRARMTLAPRRASGRFDLCAALRRPGAQLFEPPGEDGQRRGRIELVVFMEVAAR